MSVAEGLAIAYLKVGVLGVVIIVAIMLLVRAIERRAVSRQHTDGRTETTGDDGISR